MSVDQGGGDPGMRGDRMQSATLLDCDPVPSRPGNVVGNLLCQTAGQTVATESRLNLTRESPPQYTEFPPVKRPPPGFHPQHCLESNKQDFASQIDHSSKVPVVGQHVNNLGAVLAQQHPPPQHNQHGDGYSLHQHRGVLQGPLGHDPHHHRITFTEQHPQLLLHNQPSHEPHKQHPERFMYDKHGSNSNQYPRFVPPQFPGPAIHNQLGHDPQQHLQYLLHQQRLAQLGRQFVPQPLVLPGCPPFPDIDQRIANLEQELLLQRQIKQFELEKRRALMREQAIHYEMKLREQVLQNVHVLNAGPGNNESYTGQEQIGKVKMLRSPASEDVVDQKSTAVQDDPKQCDSSPPRAVSGDGLIGLQAGRDETTRTDHELSELREKLEAREKLIRLKELSNEMDRLHLTSHFQLGGKEVIEMTEGRGQDSLVEHCEEERGEPSWEERQMQLKKLVEIERANSKLKLENHRQFMSKKHIDLSVDKRLKVGQARGIMQGGQRSDESPCEHTEDNNSEASSSGFEQKVLRESSETESTTEEQHMNNEQDDYMVQKQQEIWDQIIESKNEREQEEKLSVRLIEKLESDKVDFKEDFSTHLVPKQLANFTKAPLLTENNSEYVSKIDDINQCGDGPVEKMHKGESLPSSKSNLFNRAGVSAEERIRSLKAAAERGGQYAPYDETGSRREQDHRPGGEPHGTSTCKTLIQKGRVSSVNNLVYNPTAYESDVIEASLQDLIVVSKTRESQKVKKKEHGRRVNTYRETMKNEGMGGEFDQVRRQAAEETKLRIAAQDKDRAKKIKEIVSKECQEASKRKKKAEAMKKSLDTIYRGHVNDKKTK